MTALLLCVAMSLGLTPDQQKTVDAAQVAYGKLVSETRGAADNAVAAAEAAWEDAKRGVGSRNEQERNVLIRARYQEYMRIKTMRVETFKDPVLDLTKCKKGAFGALGDIPGVFNFNDKSVGIEDGVAIVGATFTPIRRPPQRIVPPRFMLFYCEGVESDHQSVFGAVYVVVGTKTIRGKKAMHLVALQKN